MSTLRRRDRTDRAGSVWLIVAAAALLPGCITGERPTFETLPEVTDPAAAGVIERLSQVEFAEFTATYEITPSTTGTPTEAVVRQLDDRRRVTIGDVEFVTEDGVSRTCERASGECVQFLDDARVSNLGITNRFYSDGFSTRLAVDTGRRIGFSESRTETIAERSAACAEVPVAGGDKLYCALDEGVLARYFGADVSIELISYSEVVDPASLDVAIDPQN